MTKNTLLLIWLFVHVSSCWEFSIQIDEYRVEFINTENNLWHYWENYTHDSNENANQEVKHLMQKMASFDKQTLNKLPQTLIYGVEPLRAIKKFMELQRELVLINTTYNKYERYRNKCLQNKNRLCQFDGLIDDVTNPDSGVKAVMSRIQDILYTGTDCFMNDLSRFTSINSYSCENVPQSAQQLYYNFYNLLALNQLKAYILLQITNMIKFLSNTNDPVTSVTTISNYKTFHAKHDYKEWMQTAFDRLHIDKSREIVKCDPNGFMKGVNYDQFTRLLQGHIENEVDMSYSSSCTNTCEDYIFIQRTSRVTCHEQGSEYCQKVPKCNGNLISCFFVEPKATICISKNPDRRYEWVTYESGLTLGRKTHCSERRTINSWRRWFVRCTYCMCLCDEVGGRSDRYISMRPSLSDFRNNMVVTGIRFKKHNRMLHLQIQQGKLLSYGRIDPSTVRWVPVDNFKITDVVNGRITEGTDFIALKYESRNMALDDISVDEGENSNRVVTGVYFDKYNDMIQLIVLSHPFDWYSGDIYPPLRNSTKIDNRLKIDLTLTKPDVPVRTDVRSEIHTEPHKYVQFTHTDYDKDAAQTTIPFIDLQEVLTDPPVPLTGIGIVYRGNSGFGGFIAPKVRTYNYGRLLNKNFPEKRDTPD